MIRENERERQREEGREVLKGVIVSERESLIERSECEGGSLCVSDREREERLERTA